MQRGVADGLGSDQDYLFNQNLLYTCCGVVGFETVTPHRKIRIKTTDQNFSFNPSWYTMAFVFERTRVNEASWFSLNVTDSGSR